MSKESEQYSEREVIPVLRPSLPIADSLLPYLRRIDFSRVYSNFGPLVLELEHRLCISFGLPEGSVVTASSGSSALVGAILATAGRASPERRYAVIPAFTFVATAGAVEQSGYRPYLMDITPNSWTLDPEALIAHPKLDEIGLVVPVSTFGRPVELSQWVDFSRRTGIPVVVDGAASFDSIFDQPGRYLGEIPVAVSFHATKSFATGEGGCIVTTDTDLMLRVSAALNFGFAGTRDSVSASVNGKMSEYHAAVGLAELDHWPAKAAAMRNVIENYKRSLREADLGDRLYCAPTIGSCYVLFLSNDSQETTKICDSLTRHGVDFRFWYGLGLQNHTYYRNCERGSLPVTEQYAERLIGLPFAPDLSTGAIRRIAVALREGAENTAHSTSDVTDFDAGQAAAHGP